MAWEKADWTMPSYMGRGVVNRSGYRLGAFGVYKARSGWFADHIPSGFSLSLLDAPKLADAKRNAERAAAIPGIDWNDSGLADKVATWRSAEGDALPTAVRKALA